MPAPVSSTVCRPSTLAEAEEEREEAEEEEEEDLRCGDDGAERKLDSAAMAPAGVLALLGMIRGGGRGPV